MDDILVVVDDQLLASLSIEARLKIGIEIESAGLRFPHKGKVKLHLEIFPLLGEELHEQFRLQGSDPNAIM